MGKASKWFRGLLGLNKKPTTQQSSISSSSSCSHSKTPPKKKWSFIIKSNNNKEKDHYYVNTPINEDHDDPSKQAIAVAVAQAAAEVVSLTSSGRTTVKFHGVNGGRQEWAAIKIQSHFRAYLARRALRALKALVKIQALVRGHIVRKRTTDNIRRVHSLLRVQARALARRSLNFGSPYIDNNYTHPGHPTSEKNEHVVRAKSMNHDGSMMLKRNGSRSDVKAFIHQGRANVSEQGHVKHGRAEDERSDKILEIDRMHKTPPKHRNLFHSSHLSLCSDQYSQSFTTSKESTTHQTIPSPSFYDFQSLSHFKLTHDLEDGSYFTAESSPQFNSATSKNASTRRGPFTPTKSEDSKSCHSVYSDHRNYMSLTESSKAKMRSLSAPRHRPQYERSSSAKRYSTPSYRNDSRMNPRRGSGSDANFTNMVYPGSGYLDRNGMPTAKGHQEVARAFNYQFSGD